MSLKVNRICSKFLRIFLECRNYSTAPKLKDINGRLIIGCKRKQLDHYSSTNYNSLDQVPLASKGWNHSKAKDDFFTVYPRLEDISEETYNWEQCGLNHVLINNLINCRILKATDFQYRAILTIESGTHTLLAAETGCGKTIGYLLPVIKKLIGNEASNLNSPKALVIVPNRELAYQVGEVAQSLTESLGLNVKMLVGGRTKKLMMNPEFSKVDILVATPGSLGKLSTVGIYKLNDVQYTIFDEADTLLDDSFIERMSSLVKRVSRSQIILVSATLPKYFPDILSHIEPTLKHVVSPMLHKPLENITQKFLRLTKSSKPSHLLQLAKNNNSPMLIFTNKNQTCNWVALFLRENGIACSNINGNMNYQIRIDQWNQFVRGNTQILAATDVGSRGLNTIQVRHVLNYDFPLYAADYLHRIGRVGRLGSPSSCKVTNFISGSEEIELVQQIELAIRRNKPLTNVDGNITNIVQRNMARKLRETA